MRIEWIIFFWLLARCIFIGLPDYNIDPFLFSDSAMPVSSYGWVNVEMTFMCWLAVKWYASSELKKIPAMLFLVLAFDWVHFILGGNAFYFTLLDYPMTNNVLMLIFWGIFALKSRKHDV